DAIEAYTKASVLQPDNSTIWGNMAVTYFDSKDYEKSIETAQKALELSKDEKWLLGYQITSSVMLGKQPQAVEYANQLLSIENSLHEIATAIMLLEECKKNNPEIDGIYDLILKLQSYSDDPEEKNKSIEDDSSTEDITDTAFDKDIISDSEEVSDIEIDEITIEPDDKK
ncbi:MAG: tetratricopeptide repeat protein, partial [Fibrobacter sp.]|nr:tetratricopeptide repeat protein [Fibrobacter sp.]